jgi:hypothetical protein
MKLKLKRILNNLKVTLNYLNNLKKVKEKLFKMNSSPIMKHLKETLLNKKELLITLEKNLKIHKLISKNNNLNSNLSKSLLKHKSLKLPFNSEMNKTPIPTGKNLTLKEKPKSLHFKLKSVLFKDPLKT